MSKQAPTIMTHKTHDLLTKLGKRLRGKDAPIYTAVDLSQKVALHEHTFYHHVLFDHQLFGTKLTKAQGLSHKLIPKQKTQGAVDYLYLKLAHWAKSWALSALAKDPRFDTVNTLSALDKTQFASDIADQTRALATLGGAWGAWGLKGVVLDTAWLLLVSLRGVYQLAYVYGVPLTGKDGVAIAYQIVGAMDLQKLQQKQLLLIALAVSNVVLKNAQNTSLPYELGHIHHYGLLGNYAKQFDELSRFVDLDKLDNYLPSWLRFVLPALGASLGGVYNKQLIDDVLGVAVATFAVQNDPEYDKIAYFGA